jgi:hypothetical protein
VLDGVGGQRHAPATLPLRKTDYEHFLLLSAEATLAGIADTFCTAEKETV